MAIARAVEGEVNGNGNDGGRAGGEEVDGGRRQEEGAGRRPRAREDHAHLRNRRARRAGGCSAHGIENETISPLNGCFTQLPRPRKRR